MSLSTLNAKILTALLEIRDEGPSSNASGICHNLDKNVFIANDKRTDLKECGEVSNWLEFNFVKWPKFSGEIAYPVPTPEGVNFTPETMYFAQEDQWVGEYGELRYELLDFLIAQLVEEDRRAA